MKQLLFVAAIVSLIGCNQSKPGSKEEKTSVANPALDSVQTIINAELDYHTVSINMYDSAGSGAMFTDDASVIEYLETVKKMNGRAEINSSIALELAEFKKTNTKFDIKWTTHSLRLSGDKAFHDASVAYTMNTPGAEPVKLGAEAMMIWKKTGENKWKAQTLILYAN